MAVTENGAIVWPLEEKEDSGTQYFVLKPPRHGERPWTIRVLTNAEETIEVRHVRGQPPCVRCTACETAGVTMTLENSENVNLFGFAAGRCSENLLSHHLRKCLNFKNGPKYERAGDKPTTVVKMCEALVRHHLPLHTDEQVNAILARRFKQDQLASVLWDDGVLEATGHILHEQDLTEFKKTRSIFKPKAATEKPPRTPVPPVPPSPRDPAESSPAGSSRGKSVKITSSTPAFLKQYLPPSRGCTARMNLVKKNFQMDYPERAAGLSKSVSKSWRTKGFSKEEALAFCLAEVWSWHMTAHPGVVNSWNFDDLEIELPADGGEAGDARDAE